MIFLVIFNLYATNLCEDALSNFKAIDTALDNSIEDYKELAKKQQSDIEELFYLSLIDKSPKDIKEKIQVIKRGQKEALERSYGTYVANLQKYPENKRRARGCWSQIKEDEKEDMAKRFHGDREKKYEAFKDCQRVLEKINQEYDKILDLIELHYKRNIEQSHVFKDYEKIKKKIDPILKEEITKCSNSYNAK